MPECEIREAWFDTDSKFIEGSVVSANEAAAAVNRCYDQSLKSYETTSDDLAETYRCFFSDTSQLEISVHSISLATVTYRTEAVSESRWFGFMSQPFERELNIIDRATVLRLLRQFFGSSDEEMVNFISQLRT